MALGSRKYGWLAIGLCTAGLGAGMYVRHFRPDNKKTSLQAEHAAVTVRVAKASLRDVPVVLSGLGNVTAYYTAVVRSQVDGVLTKVLFKEGQHVRQGDVLATIDPRPFDINLRSAQANLDRDEATLKNYRLNLERNHTLLEKKLISEQTVTDLQSSVDQFAATVLADKAAVQNARLQLEWSQITAPISGQTGIRLTDPGNLVHASDANGIVIITQIDPITVVFSLPEDYLPQISQQMRTQTLKALAYSRDGNTQLGSGDVVLIDNQLQQATGTIRLKAVFENKEQALWPNQFVRVDLQLKMLPNALVVPAVAIQHGPHGDYVYRVEDKEHVAKVVLVDTDMITESWAVITKGLSEHDTVVTDGQYKLHDGASILLSNADDKTSSHSTTSKQ